MKALVISDSHGYISNARIAIGLNPDVEIIIHLGDYYKDAVRLSELYPNIRFEFVSGNCDGNKDISTEKVLEIENNIIFITHGHNYSVKLNYKRILERAKAENAKLVLFGHTHVATIEKIDNILLLNPGSITQSRSRFSESYAILDINKNKIFSDILYF
ncbi:metallophosphoesterase [Ruminiclostridium herbifermentans]|uniref:Phosphoesterase n=1 Tax=Ruminiclostridium herbifermentans TaxID=2488810 RepID=A0A4U7JJY3_9FIRM|nr:metallophosphoesterase [Ruminiclostridium herbifermentans]QNU68275.1 metallophosphoesterase [Ruminiclostridium herbifermentans]